ncbi:DUF6011 domain-containing protein [Streptomyces sp. NPDC058280]|uniref:DUF6011 domain-containing protein n=1 Tax=Streptomyces sp. NPDC058280 TaxID=3346419 RepID=UPI0036ED347E
MAELGPVRLAETTAIRPPTHMVAATARCGMCGRLLTDDTSRALGLGPKCEAKLHSRGRRDATHAQLTFPTTKDTAMDPTTTRQFTRDDLADLGVPPGTPGEADWTDAVLADEYVSTGKYTQQRRVVFQDDDGETWAVEYEASLGGHQDEAPDDHGWDGDTIEATAVEEQVVLVPRWVPVDSDDKDDNEPEADETNDTDSDNDSDVFALIAEIASRLRDATDEAEYHAVGLIHDLASGRTTIADARTELECLTLRHI